MYLMHKNAMDVCFKVMGTFRVNQTRVKHSGLWINLGYSGNPFQCASGKLDLDHNSSPNWIVLSREQVYTKRTKSGLPEGALK